MSTRSGIFDFVRDNGEASSASARWPVKDIVYVGVVGCVMLAALLEWMLWLLAFLYCLVKVFQKADGEGKWGIRILAVANMIFFVAMRCIFLPIMIVTLPLPPQIVHHFPEEMVGILQWFAFWSFAGLLTVPWLFCVYQLVTHNVGRTRKVKTVLDEHSAPKTVIVMPCYNEEPEILLRTVDSIVECEYPPSCLHVFLSFDGDSENELYLNTIERLGVPLTLDRYPKSIDVTYRSCRVTVSRFPHGGKRSCQKKTFKLIDKVYAEYLRRHDNLFLLFIDSDCILDKLCIQNFMYEMELKPGSKRNMLAMTGVITSTTVKNTLITVLQDMEYIHGQLFERSVESGCGAVTCLPGALTILRFSAFRRMAKFYFADKAEQCDDLFDYGKCHLGEDRWLTHLFMIGAPERYQIQMNTGAFCKTEAVQTFKSLLKQRRRWFLGFITNEACMLTDVRLWRCYPLLLVIRLASNTIRTTALLFFIMVISVLTTSEKITNLPVGFIAVSLGLNWVLMLYFGAKLGRYKIMLYPIMFVLNPFFNWLYMVYGIFTAGQRTWGGPRADAGKADEKTTPEQAVQIAAAGGDELNVVPETFKPALEAAKGGHSHHMPLMPSRRLVGRFAPAEELPGGWYRQANDSGALHSDMTPQDQESMRYPRGLRQHSADSFHSAMSTNDSIHTPRRVESLIGRDDSAPCRDEHDLHSPARGDDVGNSAERAQPRASGALQRNDRYSESVHSVSSSLSSVSMHFGGPSRPPGCPDPGAEYPLRPTARAQTRPPTPPLPSARPATAPQFQAATSQNFPVMGPVPQATQGYRPGPRRTFNRVSQSPLARKSFTHLAADISSPVDEGAELSRRHSVAGHERRARRWRRSTSTSVGPDGRRRLSKQRPGSRAQSQE